MRIGPGEIWIPERIKTLELNFLYSRSDLGLGLSLFMNDIENLQSVSYPNGVGNETSADSDDRGRMESHGAELILSYRPIDSLDLGFGATW